MSLQDAVRRYSNAMSGVEQLRRSYSEYGRGRLAISLLKDVQSGRTPDPDDLRIATGRSDYQRDRGNPGHISAVRPAIVLSSISTFEGFVEDFLAEALSAAGYTLAQIARELGGNNLNNPSVSDWRTLAQKYFAAAVSTTGFSVTIDRYDSGRNLSAGSSNTNFYTVEAINWSTAERLASGWMTVRHVITHGGATGLATEVWPPPIRRADVAATEVLKPEGAGGHTLRFRAAVAVGRLHVHTTRYLADQIAASVGETLDWAGMPAAFVGPNPS